MVSRQEVEQFIENGDLVAAERILKSSPPETPHGDLFVEVLLRLGKLEEAIPWVWKFVEYYRARDQEFFDDVGEHSARHYPEYQMHLALYQFITGEVEASMKSFEALFRENPNKLKEMLLNKTFSPVFSSKEFNELIKPTAVYELNENIVLKLILDKTLIFVCGDLFITCQKTIIALAPTEFKDYDDFYEIDDIIDYYREEETKNKEWKEQGVSISPEEEFWVHCSNMQAWVDSGYNSRVLSKSVSFPILIELSKREYSQFTAFLKEDLVQRIQSGSYNAIEYFMQEDFYRFFTQDEFFELLLCPEETEIMKEVASVSKLEYCITASVNASRGLFSQRVSGKVHFSYEKGHITELELFFDEIPLSRSRIREVIREVKKLTHLKEVAIYGYIQTMNLCSVLLKRKGLRILKAPYDQYFKEREEPPWKVLEID